MSVIAIVSLLIASVLAANQNICVNQQGQTPNYQSSQCFWTSAVPTTTTLTYCSDFSTNACCTSMIDGALQTAGDSTLRDVYGTDCCYRNMKLLSCALNCGGCSTKASSWIQDPVSHIYNATLYMSTTFAQGLYDSCSHVCISAALGGPPMTVAEFYGSPAAFIASMKSDNNPAYHPNEYSPRVFYAIGYSPDGATFNMNAASACGNDNAGCPETTCGDGAVVRPNPDLEYCNYYNNAEGACCTDTQDAGMKENLQEQAAYMLGTDCCFENIKRTMCGWLCHPNSTDFTTYVLDKETMLWNMTIYIDETCGQAFYDSCKDRCMNFGNRFVVKEMYPTAPEFISVFNSANVPGFDPSVNHLNMIYEVGTSPVTGHSYKWDVVAACGDDLIGCSVKSSGGDSNDNDNGVTAGAAVMSAMTITTAAGLCMM